MWAGVSKSGSPISRWTIFCPRASSALALLVVLGSVLTGIAPGSIAPARATTTDPTPEQAAMAQAQRTGEQVQVGADTTETTIVEANPDGTFTAQVAAGPVR